MNINNILNFLSNCSFIINIAFLLFLETCKYYTYKDYDKCVYTLANKLASKNILYVKIFQACALNNNMINNNTLLEFTDKAPYLAEEIDFNTLHELEKTQNLTIQNNFTPINSGMISLVFKGIYNETQEEIAIKIKRKNIEERLNKGIQKLLFIVKIIERLPYDNFDIPNIIYKNIELITDQTDFSKEIKNVERFKQICIKIPSIKIPRIYPTIFKDIIVMEFLQGLKIQTITEPAEKLESIKQIFNFIFSSIFINGVIHGDLHSGNILFLKDENVPNKYNLGILDFGIIYEIGNCRNSIIQILGDMYDTSPREVAIKVLKSGLLEPMEYIENLKGEEYENIINILNEYIIETLHVAKKLNILNIYNFTRQLNVCIKKSNYNFILKVSDDCVKIQIAFGMLHSVLQHLCENDKYMEIVNNFINEDFIMELICNA
jgi:predicted unusual protein kinase regulating ubiquinone biosynthesis (AarF/ABC1/UbiB family)